MNRYLEGRSWAMNAAGRVFLAGCVWVTMLAAVTRPVSAVADETAKTNAPAANATADAVAVPTVHLSLPGALEAASTDRALLLVAFGADWCGPCVQMKKSVYPEAPFATMAGPLHVVHIDVDRDQRRAAEFGVRSIPTLVLLTQDGKIVSRRTGFARGEELVAWIEQGRRRAEQGVWEGVAWGDEAVEWLPRVNEKIPDESIPRLLEMMGHRDEGMRGRVTVALVARRDDAMPVVLRGLGHDYLGVRLTASEVLHRLAPDAPVMDPWADRAERDAALASVKEWWEKTGKLPSRMETAAADPAAVAGAERALAMMMSRDPAERTRGMTTLVGLGSAALGPVREALRRAEREGEQRLMVALDEVRWAVLVTDDVEKKAPGARRVLAHGNSADRQEMTAALGKVGEPALPVLTELVADADPLVKESALVSLGMIGDDAAVRAMAVLLRSADSNLRITSVQALGSSRSSEAAVPHLVAALEDTNELVVCAALAGLEQAKAKSQCAPVAARLADTRWRVRAAAAETLGKLECSDASGTLRELMEAESDGFVLQEVLKALKGLKVTVSPREMKSLADRQPSMKYQVVAMLSGEAKEESATVVTEMFRAGSESEQLQILRAFQQRKRSEAYGDEPQWKPLFQLACASPSAAVRRASAELLTERSATLGAEFAGGLLSDPDMSVRRMSVRLVVRVAAHHWGTIEAHGAKNHGVLAKKPKAGEAGAEAKPEEKEVKPAGGEDVKSKENADGEGADGREQVVALHRQWHEMLSKMLVQHRDLATVVAYLATAEGEADMTGLTDLVTSGVLSVSKADEDELNMTVGLLLRRLPWPSGERVVETLMGSAQGLTLVLGGLSKGRDEIRVYVLDPGRLSRQLEKLNPSESELDDLVSACFGSADIFGYRNNAAEAWRLTLEPVYRHLEGSSNAVWRATGLFGLGLAKAGDAGDRAAARVSDPNEWVRRTALGMLAVRETDPVKRMTLCRAHLDDESENVARMAVIGMMEPSILNAASLGHEMGWFKFGTISTGGSGNSGSSDDRPVRPMDGPEDLKAQLRASWEKARNGKVELEGVLVLALAQYGDFEPLDQLILRISMTERDDRMPVVVAGIALSGNVKYLPFLRRLIEVSNESWRLRTVLQAMRGMSGTEVRKMRLEINRKMAALEE